MFAIRLKPPSATGRIDWTSPADCSWAACGRPVSGGKSARYFSHSLDQEPSLDRQSKREPSGGDAAVFGGFKPLDANYLYCPNQFFDVCMANSSRGAVRCVAYVLRQTLGWLDKNGNPIREDIVVPYRDFIEKAGISRGALADVLDEVVSSGFLLCTSPARPKSRGTGSMSAAFRLRWASSGREYTKDPKRFTGFFSGEGNRTPVPNQFFDLIVPSETGSVIKVVGSVLRHTIGYQNQFGGHRSETPLSFTAIQRYANISDRKTIAAAIRTAQERGYIERTKAGKFSADKTQQATATYSPRWLLSDDTKSIGSRTLPEDRSNNPTRNSSETPPDDRFRNPTTTKETENKTLKQQQTVAADSESVSLLTDAGFDKPTAQRLAGRVDAEVIRRQIEWLPERGSNTNKLGMLRRAIEEDWPAPPSIVRKEREAVSLTKARAEAEAARREDEQLQAKKMERVSRRDLLASFLKSCSPEEIEEYQRRAAEVERSDFLRDKLGRPFEELNAFEQGKVLDQLARERGLPRLIEDASDHSDKS